MMMKHLKKYAVDFQTQKAEKDIIPLMNLTIVARLVDITIMRRQAPKIEKKDWKTLNQRGGGDIQVPNRRKP